MPDQAGWPDPGPAVSTGGPVNGFQVLEQVASLPISTWRYHWEAPQVRHLGPMVQDWAATFGIGETTPLSPGWMPTGWRWCPSRCCTSSSVNSATKWPICRSKSTH
jgi:hypothetical protein